MRTSRAGDGGFTLVELMVALLVLSIIMSATLYSILSGLRVSRDNQLRVQAANIVSTVLEGLHSEGLTASGFAAIAVGSTTLPAQTVGNEKFTITQDTEWVSEGTSQSACNTSSTAGLILRATVTATWGNSAESATESTLLAPPSGAFDSNEGFVGVQVDGASGAGYQGATVALTPPSGVTAPASEVTGTDGCVFFTDLQSGSYAVTVSSPTGIDEEQQNVYNSANEGQYEVVTATSPKQATVPYDNFGYLDWTLAPAYPQWSLTTYPAASGMPLSVDSPSLGWDDDMYSFGTSISGTDNGSVETFPAAYDVFSGGCNDADPNGAATGVTGTSFYPAATYPAATYPDLISPASVTGGSVTSADSYLYPLQLAITGPTGTPISAVPTATEGQTDSGAAAGVTCPTPSTYVLGTSSATTGLSESSVGLGHLHIAATSGSLTGWVDVDVMPDGVYWTTSSGATGDYLFSATTLGSVPLQL